MSPKERENLQRLDDLILNAGPGELKKIQENDCRTQLEGDPFYAVYIDSSSLIRRGAG